MGDLGLLLETLRYPDVLEEATKMPLKIVRFTRIDEKGREIELFLVLRGKNYYLLMFANSPITIDLMASGTRANVNKVMDLVVSNYTTGTGHLYGYGGKIVAAKVDAKAKKDVEIFNHPLFGIKKWRKKRVSDLRTHEMEDFYRLVRRQVKNWKGGSDSFRSMGHSFWPEFRKMVVEAIGRKYGQKITLYRGVFGEIANQVILGGGLPTNIYASWTLDSEYAKDFVVYGGDKWGGPNIWVTVKAVFTPEDVIFANVKLPKFKPDPNVLKPFGWESEFVVKHDSKILPRNRFKISAKTRSKFVGKK